MLNRLHPIPERHGRTDRQTDGRTELHAISIIIIIIIKERFNVAFSK